MRGRTCLGGAGAPRRAAHPDLLFAEAAGWPSLPGRRSFSALTAYSAQGLSTWTPARSKSLTLRVTTIMPCTRNGQVKVLDVACDHDHAVHPRRCRDERVDHGERLGVLLPAPGSGDREGDWENTVFESCLYIPEPAFKGRSQLRIAPTANS